MVFTLGLLKILRATLKGNSGGGGYAAKINHVASVQFVLKSTFLLKPYHNVMQRNSCICQKDSSFLYFQDSWSPSSFLIKKGIQNVMFPPSSFWSPDFVGRKSPVDICRCEPWNSMESRQGSNLLFWFGGAIICPFLRKTWIIWISYVRSWGFQTISRSWGGEPGCSSATDANKNMPQVSLLRFEMFYILKMCPSILVFFFTKQIIIKYFCAVPCRFFCCSVKV